MLSLNTALHLMQIFSYSLNRVLLKTTNFLRLVTLIKVPGINVLYFLHSWLERREIFTL